jgi:hypothetical protein
MNRNDFQKVFWSYYLNLEERFINTIKYVEVAKNNYSTYSIEYTSLLLSICSEIDVIFKKICGFNQKKYKCINDYFSIVSSKFPDIVQEKVIYSFSSINLMPFNGWNAFQSPIWWTNYNKLKHGRLNNFTLGNLKNVLNALAALYTLERYQLKNIVDKSSSKNEPDIPDIPSKIFNLSMLTSSYIHLTNAMATTEVD